MKGQRGLPWRVSPSTSGFVVSGIGKAVASDLAKRKAKVYMLCRDMVKCEEARKELVLSTRNRQVHLQRAQLIAAGV